MTEPMSAAVASRVARTVDFSNDATAQQNIHDIVASNKLKLDAQLTASEQNIEHRLASAAPGSADFYVEVEALVDFYNSLSGVHQALTKQYTELKANLKQATAHPASTLHPTINAAWETIRHQTGVDNNKDSLLGNIDVIDQLVVDHMDAVLHNLNNYLKADQDAVEHIGKAAAMLDAYTPPEPSTATTPRTDPSAQRGWGTAS